MDHFSTSGSTQRTNKELVVVVLAHAKLQAGNSSRAVTNEIINATIATPPGRQKTQACLPVLRDVAVAVVLNAASPRHPASFALVLLPSMLRDALLPTGFVVCETCWLASCRCVTTTLLARTPVRKRATSSVKSRDVLTSRLVLGSLRRFFMLLRTSENLRLNSSKVSLPGGETVYVDQSLLASSGLGVRRALILTWFALTW